jgi:hypothetical protein
MVRAAGQLLVAIPSPVRRQGGRFAKSTRYWAIPLRRCGLFNMRQTYRGLGAAQVTEDDSP